MADQNELHIPTDRIPPELLRQLREIGLLFQYESTPTGMSSSSTTSSSSSLTSSFSLSALAAACSQSGQDETDDLSQSENAQVVHVIDPEVTPRSKSAPAPEDSDVVSVFSKGRTSPPKEFPPFTQQNPFSFARPDLKPQHQQQASDVVSVFTPPKASPSSKDVVYQSPVQQSCSPQKLCLSRQQQYSDFRDYRSTHIPSTSSTQSSPCKSIRDDDVTDSYLPVPTKSLHRPEASQSPSMSSESSVMPPSTLTSTALSFRSRSPMSQVSNVHPEDESIIRVLPSKSATPTLENTSQQQMLTPPETPESEGGKCRQVVAEVFTFDDMTCTQERFRQNYEQMCQIQQQDSFEQQQQQQFHTPPKRTHASTPRPLQISTPSTPSYRRQEVPRSPSFLTASPRRISPVDSRLYNERFEAATSLSSPQSKKKDVPGSPASCLQQQQQQQTTTPQRLSLPHDEFTTPPRRDSRESLSPKFPKKRLDFKEQGESTTGVSPQQQQPQTPRSIPRGFESNSATQFSPRGLAGSSSGSDSVFTFSGGARAPPNTPGKPSSFAPMADFLDRMASIAAFQGGYEVDEDDERSSYGGAAGAVRSLSYDSGIGQARMAMFAGSRLTMKRKRPDDDSDSQCSCATMRQDFLQMAENAFKKVRRRDSSSQDFERFRMELIQTNDILRESMQLMAHIGDICDHRMVAGPWRPRW